MKLCHDNLLNNSGQNQKADLPGRKTTEQNHSIASSLDALARLGFLLSKDFVHLEDGRHRCKPFFLLKETYLLFTVFRTMFWLSNSTLNWKLSPLFIYLEMSKVQRQKWEHTENALHSFWISLIGSFLLPACKDESRFLSRNLHVIPFIVLVSKSWNWVYKAYLLW